MRIAVTGLGVVSCCGNTVDKLWDNIANGISGIRPLTKYTPTVIKTRNVGEVQNFSLDTVFDPRWTNKTDTHIQFALNAAKQAIDQSGLEIEFKLLLVPPADHMNLLLTIKSELILANPHFLILFPDTSTICLVHISTCTTASTVVG